MEPIEKIKEIILDNNYFDTLAGQRFVEMYDVRNIQAIISFGGRSKQGKSYMVSPDSDSDAIYVTHLYIDRYGDVKVQMSTVDDDDYSNILKPSDEDINRFDESILMEWVKLLTY